MEPVMELLDIHSDLDAFGEYFKRFKIWPMTKEDVEDVIIVAHFPILIGKQAYSLLKTLALPEKPISLSYTTLKDLLLDFRSAATDAKICNSDPVKLAVSDDHLSLSMTSKSGIDSRSEPDLNETQNPCGKSVYTQSNYQIPHVIVPNMVCTNNSHIFYEISHKSEDNMLNEPSHARKSVVVLVGPAFSNDSLLCRDILNKFEETISKESNLNVISNIISPPNAFVSCGKLAQCEARVLNDLDFDYNSHGFISTAVYPYHK
ncbi:unnamed protein product, partial [Schistosoma curassoni]|uniref:Rho-GAP domain-containing protein n=1 Tax=Schistosoma curassoni TaxID=6186 RepID=A0A183L0J3_9TREM